MLGGQSSPIFPCDVFFTRLQNGPTCKKKRRPAGTPDPDAEVVSLSPETLMETDSYICEICNQGFPREQNLQMHRRRHNVPWKLLKSDAQATDAPKRVYVCPELTCLHHDPSHALGDLVGIRKHFKRKHTNQRQWVCEKCSKGYAVQSDLKAHLKTCGTRGHSCDCGRVFSRVETFIEHQDTCKAPKPVYLLQSCLNPSLSINTNFRTTPPLPNSRMLEQPKPNHFTTSLPHKFELQKLTSSSNPLPGTLTSVPLCTQLKLSVGSSSHVEKNELNSSSSMNNDSHEEPVVAVVQRLKDEAREQLQMAAEEKTFAEKKRQLANWQIELAKQEMINANRIREQALAELSKAQVLKERAMKQINPNTLQITCNACKKQYFSNVYCA